MTNLWIPNRSRPRLLCRLLHRRLWFSNDFGTWHSSGRTFFEIRCVRCGDCWSARVEAA